MSTETESRLRDFNYALSKQVPVDSETLTINSSYGDLTLDGAAGRKAVKVIRMVLHQEITRLERQLLAEDDRRRQAEKASLKVNLSGKSRKHKQGA